MEKGRLIIDGVDVSGSVGSAASVPYSNTNSGLEATNTQGAIDELATSVTELNSNLNSEKIILELSSTVTLVRIGNVVQICFSGCKSNSVPDIPTEHLPITNSTILAFSNDGTNNFFLRVIYKSDGTKGVYKGGDSVNTSNYSLYGSGTWLAN